MDPHGPSSRDVLESISGGLNCLRAVAHAGASDVVDTEPLSRMLEVLDAALAARPELLAELQLLKRAKAILDAATSGVDRAPLMARQVLDDMAAAMTEGRRSFMP